MKNGIIKYVDGYTGAGFKIPHHAGAKYEQDKLDKSKYVEVAKYGVSSGSIIQFVQEIAGTEVMKKQATTYQSSDVFVQDPNKLMGHIFAVARILTGKVYLYDQSKLVTTLRNVVTKQMFDDWSKNKYSVPVHAVCVNLETAEIVDLNLKEMDYESALRGVMASASIPVFTKPIELDGKILVDGGLREHCPSVSALKKYGAEIDMCLSVFSRPNNIEKFAWDMPKQVLGKINGIKILNRVLEILNMEISKSDEAIIDHKCQSLGISNNKVFTEDILSDSVYKSSMKEQMEWFEQGRSQFKTLNLK